MSQGRVDQANLPDVLRDHDQRLRSLEATPPGAAGDGIQFDTDNEGGSLDITTHDVDGDGYGAQIFDRSGGGMLLGAEDTGVSTLEMLADGTATLTGEEKLTLESSVEVDVDCDQFNAHASTFTLHTSGDTFLVSDHLGNPIFELTG